MPRRISRASPATSPSPIPAAPGKTKGVLETPAPAKWPVYVFYFKPVIVLLNVVPYLVMLIAYARLLDRHAPDDWSWMVALASAAFGTPLFVFATTLEQPQRRRGLRGVRGVRAGADLGRRRRGPRDGSPPRGSSGRCARAMNCRRPCSACCCSLMLLVRFPRKTLIAFVPAAIVPCVAFLANPISGDGAVEAGVLGIRHGVVQLRGELLEHPPGDGLVRQAPGTARDLPAAHGHRPSRLALVDADPRILALGGVAESGGGRRRGSWRPSRR